MQKWNDFCNEIAPAHLQRRSPPTYDDRGYPEDPREPRDEAYLRSRNIPMIFRNHNCARCHDGERACVRGNPSTCGWPHARND